MKEISIILSTYNWSKFLEESILSVLSQSYKLFEFIIINDASSDNQVERIIFKYLKKDCRIIYIKNEVNIWLTQSLNKWINLSTWRYIARIDDDDTWIDKDKLKKQIRFMEKNLDYWLCWSSVIVVDTLNNFKKINMKENDSEIRKTLLRSNQFIHSSVLIRTSTLNSVWWKYLPSYNWAEDYELWLRIWAVSSLYNMQDFLVQYRKLPNSISNKRILTQEFRTLRAIVKHRGTYKWFIKSISLRSVYSLLRVIRLENLLK